MVTSFFLATMTMRFAGGDVSRFDDRSGSSGGSGGMLVVRLRWCVGFQFRGMVRTWMRVGCLCVDLRADGVG